MVETNETEEAKKKPFTDQVIDLYETCLRNALIISTSFRGVVHQKLDPKRRWLQTIYLLVVAGYVIPRNFILLFLYLKDEDTRRSWTCYLPDYFQEFGLFGRVLNFGFAAIGFLVFMDTIHLRAFESKGRVDYLTHMDTLRDNKRSGSVIEVDPNDSEIETLGKQEKEELLRGMRTKLLILKKSVLGFYLSSSMYHLIACPLFLYNNRPLVITGILAIINVVIMVFFIYFTDHIFITIYGSYVITVDYFSARIEFMMKGLNENLPMELKMTRVLLQYNLLMTDFQNQDYLLKYLLRNMMYSYCIGLTTALFCFTIDMNIFVRIFMLTAVVIVSLAMLSGGLYVGRLYSKSLVLNQVFNSMAVKNSREINSYKAFKINRILLNCIKELGSQQTDGQFVMGLRDGYGPAISRLEMFQLTMMVVSNTFMVIEFLR